MKKEEIKNHSGGAYGSDMEWDKQGRKYGIKNFHYYYKVQTPFGNKEITEAEYNEGCIKVAEAAKMNWGYPHQRMKNGLLSRNWQQVKHSKSIFAITKITRIGGTPFNDTRKAIIDMGSGGTSYAVGMGIIAGRKIYLFDDGQTNRWYKWNYEKRKWKPCKTPKIKGDFAGIGTRKISKNGKKAIGDVYAKTFKENK